MLRGLRVWRVSGAALVTLARAGIAYGRGLRWRSGHDLTPHAKTPARYRLALCICCGLVYAVSTTSLPSKICTIVAVSPETAQDLRNRFPLYRNGVPIETLENGLDMAFFPRSQWRRKQNSTGAAGLQYPTFGGCGIAYAARLVSGQMGETVTRGRGWR
jgi:hypothetical protein